MLGAAARQHGALLNVRIISKHFSNFSREYSVTRQTKAALDLESLHTNLFLCLCCECYVTVVAAYTVCKMSVIHRGGFCCSAELSAHPHLSSLFFFLSPSFSLSDLLCCLDGECETQSRKRTAAFLAQTRCMSHAQIWYIQGMRTEARTRALGASGMIKVFIICEESLLKRNWQPTKKFALSNCPGGPGSPFCPIGPIGPTGPGSPTRPLSPWTPLSPEIPGSPCRRHLLLLILATYTAATVYVCHWTWRQSPVTFFCELLS